MSTERNEQRTDVQTERKETERDKLIFCSKKSLSINFYALYSFQLFTGSIYVKSKDTVYIAGFWNGACDLFPFEM